MDPRRELAGRLNRAIDAALLAPGEGDAIALRRMAGPQPPRELAERVRRRAARLGKRARGLAQRRDDLIAAIYAAAAPRGWYTAWSDGSSSGAAPRRNGLGGVVRDARGAQIACLSCTAAGLDTFAAEVDALAKTLEQAAALGAKRVRAHTDCKALAQLWRARRSDPRLEGLRGLARRFYRLQIVPIPRAHNEPAHALARKATERS